MALSDLNTWISKEDLENSFDFKLFKKIILDKYDWILDIRIPDTKELNSYDLIFLQIVVNPFILSKNLNLEIDPYVELEMRRRESEWLGIDHLFGEYQKPFLKNFGKNVKIDFGETQEMISKNLGEISNPKLKERNFTYFEVIVPPISELTIVENKKINKL